MAYVAMPIGGYDAKSVGQVKTLLNSPKRTFVMVHATWCSHCKTSRPLFADAAAHSSVPFMAIESQFAGSLNVTGYPTFGFLCGGVFTKVNPERTVDGFLRAAAQDGL